MRSEAATFGPPPVCATAGDAETWGFRRALCLNAARRVSGTVAGYQPVVWGGAACEPAPDSSLHATALPEWIVYADRIAPPPPSGGVPAPTAAHFLTGCVALGDPRVLLEIAPGL